MAARQRRIKSKAQVPDHPIVPGSILYRALQQVARAVADRLVAYNEAGHGEDGNSKPRKIRKDAKK